MQPAAFALADDVSRRNMLSAPRKLVTLNDPLRYSAPKGNTTRAHFGPQTDTPEVATMENVGSTGQDTGAGVISVTVLPEQIKNGGFLLGRYNLQTGALTDIKVIKDRGHLPPNTEVTRYALIGVDDNAPGQPLDDFIEENCTGWDGMRAIELYFRRADGEFARWGPAQAVAAGS